MECVVCKSATRVKRKDIYICTSCSHIYRDYKGDSIKFHEKAYRNKDNKQFHRVSGEINPDGSINNRFHEARKTIVSNRVQKIKQFLSKDDVVLDVGAGAGTFAVALKDYVASINCLEVAESLTKECKRLGFETYENDFLIENIEKEYDSIVCFHVLEHIKDIESFVGKMLRKVKKYVIIEVPTTRCFFGSTGKIRRLHSPNDGSYDGHCHYFTKESLVLLFEKHFKIISVQNGVQAPAILLIGEKR